jgi:hemolysin III
MSKIKIPNYSLGEEITNSVSHGIGSLLSIAGLVLLILKSVEIHSTMGVVTSCIYGACLIMLYTISCIYHALSPKLKGKKVLRVIDHCNVFLLEAGTITPLVLCVLPTFLGWTVFGITWGVSILAIVFNAIDVDKFQYASLACNLIIGWSLLFLIKPLLTYFTPMGIECLVLGGVMYSIGAVLYKIGAHKKYMHSIFHFFCFGRFNYSFLDDL